MTSGKGCASPVAALLETKLDALHRRADRLFVWILLAQWAAAVAIAALVAPPAPWAAQSAVVGRPVAALLLGAAINALPIWLVRRRATWWGTRHVVAAAQILWSATLTHLTGGGIETSFHVFVSLVFLAAYRDERVLVTATLAVLADHLLRGVLWPGSVAGSGDPASWRLLEHTGWMVFEIIVLMVGCRQSAAELRSASEHEIRLEELARTFETRVGERTAQLEASRERYRTLAESTSAVPWELDVATGVFDYIGPQVAALGYPMARWKEPGFNLASIHPDDRQKAAEVLAQAVEHGSSAQLDYRLLTADGSALWLRSFIHCHRRRDGSMALRGVSVDISHNKRLELELRQAQKLESVGRLASGIAHEINTPAQFVSDNVHFAREAVGDLLALLAEYKLGLASAANDEARAVIATLARREQEVDLSYLAENLPLALERSLDGLERISGIVRSMKEFAHPDQRERVAIDLNRAVKSTITIARNEYKYVADVVTELGELPNVPCFAGELNQVVLNLVVNAAHAIAERHGDSGQRGTITVRTWCERGAAVISIADDGAGIPDAIRERIYDPFFTTKEVGRGTGQGLAIARSVVEKHGGRIECASRVGAGTTFTIRLPLDRDRAPSDDVLGRVAQPA